MVRVYNDDLNKGERHWKNFHVFIGPTPILRPFNMADLAFTTAYLLTDNERYDPSIALCARWAFLPTDLTWMWESNATLEFGSDLTL